MAWTSKRKRFILDALRLAGLIALYFAVSESDRLHLQPAVQRVVVIAALPLLAIAVAFEVRRDLRSYRELKGIRAGGRWKLGAGYLVGLDERCDGSRVGCRLEIDELTIEFGVFDRTTVPLADVVAIRARPTWIEIEAKDRRFRVSPNSYADRERLLFELAFRCNSAMERGIDETGANAAPADVSPAARADVNDLDRRLTGSGLASALAGPMDRGNPAPPRKSGLGNGLFVAPPDDAT